MPPQIRQPLHQRLLWPPSACPNRQQPCCRIHGRLAASTSGRLARSSSDASTHPTPADRVDNRNSYLHQRPRSKHGNSVDFPRSMASNDVQ
ncbi:hypothetical protein ACLOJK_020325 [Asimina triloba]